MENISELVLRLKNMYEDNIQVLNSHNPLKLHFDLHNLYKSYALSTARLEEIIKEIENIK